MENHIKNKITRMFRNSFGSCKTKNISDVVADDKPLFHPQKPQLFSHFFPPKSPLFPSIFPPKLPHTFSTPDRILFPTTDQTSPNNKQKITDRKDNKMTRGSIRPLDFDFGHRALFSSDEQTVDDDDRATLISSVSFSFSSDSSESFRRRRAERIRRRKRRAARKRKANVEAAVKDSLAVVKRSKDPYADFRASMLEMIMEKQIFGAKDLEKLLDCFLSLNSLHHHQVIVQVFTEICEALFSNFFQ